MTNKHHMVQTPSLMVHGGLKGGADSLLFSQMATSLKTQVDVV